jgi:putative ABC transport system permease protein
MRLQFLIWREWRARPGRAVLTLLSVAFAVAAVLGTSLAQSMVRQSYAALSDALAGPPALDIVAAEGGRFPLADVPPLNDLQGVRATMPMMFRATIARAAGKRWKTLVLGLDVDALEAWSGLELTAGQLPAEGGQSLIDASLAQSLRLEMPARLVVVTRRGTATTTVVGTASSRSLRTLGNGATLVVSMKTAQRWFGAAGQADRVRVFVDEAERRESLKAEIAARLPDRLVVQEPASQLRLADEILRSSELALQFAGALALAMAAFIILNTLRMNFSERRWQFSVMRAMGATSRQIHRLVTVEGLWFGCIGAALGIPAGVLVAAVLGRAMQQLLGADLPTTWPGPRSILFGACVGPAVSLAAAWMVARQSRRLSPLAGITGIEPVGLDQYPLRTTLLCAAIWSAAVGCLAAVSFEWLPANWAIPAGLAMLVAFILLIPAAMRPMVGGLTRLTPSALRTEGFLAARQLQQRSTRTGLTVGVLVVAISNGLGLGHAILNNVNDVRQWYRRSMSGDFFLQSLEASSPADAPAAQEKQVVEQLRQVEGVARVATLRFRAARASGEPVLCVARSFASEPTLPWNLSDLRAASLRRELAEGQMAISSVLAQRLHLGRGDMLRLEVQGRAFQRPIAATVNDYTHGGLAVFLDSTEAERLFDVGPVDIFLVTCRDGYPSAIESNLRTLAEQHGLALQSFADLRRYFDGLINGIVTSLLSLLALGFIVGGFGVGNTMAMSVLEMTRQIGLLRIIGMTRRQVQRFVLTEGLLIGVVGAVLGTAAGVVTALVIHFCNWSLLGRDVPLQFHSWLFLANIGGCLATALLAAWGPGRRAARTPLLEAIAYE